MRLPIAREGWPFILPLFGLSALGLVVMPLGGWAFLVLGSFVAFFFRDPERSIPTTPGLLLSPADGRIVAVSPEQNGSAPGTVVSIFLSVFDVHINRAPMTGTVINVRYQAGKFLPAFRAEASGINEQNIVTFQVGDTRVIVKQIAGILARRIVCRVKAADNLTAGERFGLIRFGSRVDILVPDGFVIHARPGQRVRGGESVIASQQSSPARSTPVAAVQPDPSFA